MGEGRREGEECWWGKEGENGWLLARVRVCNSVRNLPPVLKIVTHCAAVSSDKPLLLSM